MNVLTYFIFCYADGIFVNEGLTGRNLLQAKKRKLLIIIFGFVWWSLELDLCILLSFTVAEWFD